MDNSTVCVLKQDCQHAGESVVEKLCYLSKQQINAVQVYRIIFCILFKKSNFYASNLRTCRRVRTIPGHMTIM